MLKKNDFNPRSPHGERLTEYSSLYQTNSISTHAPRTGSDTSMLSKLSDLSYFNPRSPHGERL